MIWPGINFFEPKEFMCRCGDCSSDGSEMAIDFVEKLDQLRERVGFPLVVSSGYRCPLHNHRVSTTGFDGPHTTGRAADILVYGDRAFRILRQASLGGWMTGIGLKQTGEFKSRFIHFDDLTEPQHLRPWIWTY